jgi:ATP-dependent exoDNAse (exonuclease V) alpha subunit
VKQIAFGMKHRQSSIHLAFSMTINKSQGQSVVGLDLHTDVFAHHTDDYQI